MELIDRAALGVGRCSKDVLPAAYCAGWNGLLNIVNDAPTIDAVPVVYCRECKYARDSKDAFDCDGETPLCECDYMTLPHRRYKYCSWGQRKIETVLSKSDAKDESWEGTNETTL